MQDRQIIIADGQALTRSGLRAWLKEAGSYEEIQEVSTFKQVLNCLEAQKGDTVILDHKTLSDFSMPTFLETKRQYADVRFIFLSGDQNEDSILNILSNEIQAYVTKNCSQEEVMTAVAAVQRGETFFCNRVVGLLIKSRNTPESTGGDLTARETEIVRLIASGRSTLQIASELNLSYHTINSHRKNILRKLKIKSPAELVVYAINNELIRP